MQPTYVDTPTDPLWQPTWALGMYGLYAFWIAVALLAPYSQDAALTADPPLWGVGVGTIPLAWLALWVSWRTTAPLPGSPRQLTVAQRGLLAFNTTAAAGLLWALALLGTPTDLHKILFPAVGSVALVNGLMMVGWGRAARVDWGWAAPLVMLGGVVFAGGVVLGAWLPVDVTTNVGGVTVRFASPESRLLTGCRPLTWTSRNAEGVVTLGWQGGESYRTRKNSEMLDCPPFTGAADAPDPTYLLTMPLPDEASFTVPLSLKLVTPTDWLMLWLGGLVVVFWPPLVMRTRFYPLLVLPVGMAAWVVVGWVG